MCYFSIRIVRVIRFYKEEQLNFMHFYTELYLYFSDWNFENKEEENQPLTLPVLREYGLPLTVLISRGEREKERA